MMRYQSKTADFIYPICIWSHRWSDPTGMSPTSLVYKKTRFPSLPLSSDCLMISMWLHSSTDGQTVNCYSTAAWNSARFCYANIWWIPSLKCSVLSRISVHYTNNCNLTSSEWVSTFLTAHQHILGYLVPYDGEKAIKMWRYNQGYLATINVK